MKELKLLSWRNWAARRMNFSRTCTCTVVLLVTRISVATQCETSLYWVMMGSNSESPPGWVLVVVSRLRTLTSWNSCHSMIVSSRASTGSGISMKSTSRFVCCRGVGWSADAESALAAAVVGSTAVAAVESLTPTEAVVVCRLRRSRSLISLANGGSFLVAHCRIFPIWRADRSPRTPPTRERPFLVNHFSKQ